MGKGSKPIIGYHYRPAYHHGIAAVEIDAFLEMRAGDRTAWQGRLTASGTIGVNAPNLFGGEKDQGGLVGDMDVMFGESTQMPNSYLISTFGEKIPAWRGFTTVVWKGGRYGAMNPYPKPASYKVERILNGWDGGTAWYAAKAPIPIAYEGFPGDTVSEETMVDLKLDGAGGPTDFTDSIGNTWYRSSSTDPANTSIVDGAAYFSGRFDGSHGSYLFCDDPIGPLTNFCIRAKVNPDAGTYTQPLQIYNSEGGFLDIYFGLSTEFRLFAKRDGVFEYLESPDPIPTGQETDVALIVSAPTGETDGFARLYVNRVQVAEIEAAVASEIVLLSAIGRMRGAQANFFEGTIRNFTITTPNAAPVGFGINPAHVLYESRTCADMGREPTANINEASLQAAADRLYAEGFGICPKWDPASESVEDFENRISRLIGGSFNRSLEDGQWHLDLARGDYVLEDLPILTDDDILEFSEQPSTLDSAVNSVSVRYFDPQRKEFIVTPPVRALGLVAAFGTIHQTFDFPEIPTGSLATRVALRLLQDRTTPTRVFDMATTRRTHAWRPNTYFRLQTPKRGIADMVCVVGEKDSGSLRSGAIKMKATQEPASLPDTSFVEVESGVDTSPDQTPTIITLQRAEEAPYVEVVAALSRADLAALPADAGFAMSMAATATTDLDFTMMTSPDGVDYDVAGHGEWCATATVVEAEPLSGALLTDFTLADGIKLDQVTLGMAVVWGSELCRVAALDIEADPKTISLGRGCGDTPPTAHAAGERLWFYQTGFAYDTTEYTDGEEIDVRLLSNTGSQQVDISDASTMTVVMDQRANRPYPPGKLRINTLQYPSSVTDVDLVATWVHRDRILQADQLVDSEEAGIGPEAGTTYTVRWYMPPSTLVATEAGVSGVSSSAYEPPSSGLIRVAVESLRDGVGCRQQAEHTFAFTALAWSPADLATPPKIWLNETSAVTDAGSGACSQWNDVSGNTWHFTQATAGSRPLIVASGLNSKRTIRFDGVNDYLSVTSAGARAVFRNKSYGWLLLVRKKLASDGAFVGRHMFAAHTPSYGTSRFVIAAAQSAKNTPALIARRLDADGSSVLNASGESGTGWRVELYRMDWANGDGFIDINGASNATNAAFTSSGSTSDTDSATELVLGAITSAVGFADIEVAECVIGNSALSASDVDKLFGWAHHKWGLAGDLPIGHPYKDAPP